AAFARIDRYRVADGRVRPWLRTIPVAQQPDYRQRRAARALGRRWRDAGGGAAARPDGWCSQRWRGLSPGRGAGGPTAAVRGGGRGHDRGRDKPAPAPRRSADAGGRLVPDPRLAEGWRRFRPSASRRAMTALDVFVFLL